MTETQKLLADYLQNGSEEAFREVVTRYLDLVYSTAVRLAGGDTHLAQDVVQIVFLDLARKAKSLSGEVRLGGWLHRHTCFVAAKTLRGERRRQFRERQAAEMNERENLPEPHLAQLAPVLDEAINQLGPTDRAAVTLRFYERLDFRSVGQALGTNEAAAQKRVTRALEKLHVLLKRRGVVLSISALGALLAGEAVTAAPAGLAASVAASAVAGAAAGTGILSFLQFMASTKLKASAFIAVIAASALTPLLLEHQAQATLRGQEEMRRQQSGQLADFQADNQHLAGVLAESQAPRSTVKNQLHELLKLRGEVGRLKWAAQKMKAGTSAAPTTAEDQIAALEKMYAARVERLKQWVEVHPSETIPEMKNMTDYDWLRAVEQLNPDVATDDNYRNTLRIMRVNAENPVLGKLQRAARAYAQDNNGQFPTDLSPLAAYLKTPIDDAILQRYEIVPASSLVPELQPGGDWVITQIAPINPELDLRTAYSLTNMRSADERVTNRWTLAH